MSTSKLLVSKENGPHARLAGLIGDWEGVTSTWFEKDILADESPMQAKITLVLDNRFINYEYRGSLDGKFFEGKMLWGYNLGMEQCECSWVDTFHMGTGIMQSVGHETGAGFTVSGSYGGTDMPEPWGWRTELAILNTDQFTLTAFNISPQGEEAKATETVFRRIKL